MGETEEKKEVCFLFKALHITPKPIPYNIYYDP
jgi:hypothetical protein